jgi:hypothetical protein
MSERPTYTNNSQTVVIPADTFEFETLEESNGHATVVRFLVENPEVRPGDVLLVLSDSEIHFHGMIGIIEGGHGIATDRRGSLLPATVQ